jgi:hypothetical protein
MESLLEPEITKAVTSVLDKQFVERRVFFPLFTRYFLARERSFQIMIEDLLKHRETSQNDEPPLVLKDHVLSLRHKANKRMGYLRATYCLFKDTVSENEQDNIALMKLHMKMCIMQYHALITQLDPIETQWGVSIEDSLSENDFGSPKLGKKPRRQSNQEEQLHNKAKKPGGRMVEEDTEDSDRARPRQQPLLEVDTPVAGPSAGSPQQKCKTSATNSTETLGIAGKNDKSERIVA